MKAHFARVFGFVSSVLLLPLCVRAELPVPEEPGVISYNPVVKIAQGNQPYSETYELLITMPASITPGASIPVSLNIVPMSYPAGVTEAQAISYVSLDSAALTVTQPSEVKSVSISIAVPVGTQAGAYSWKLTTAGWPLSLGAITDSGHTINGVFEAPNTTDTSPPSIILNSPVNGTVYTYYPASGVPVNVPVDFAASVSESGEPISGLAAYINGNPVSFTPGGLNTLAATGVGSVNLTAAGNYTINVNATNLHGTSTATSDISVVVSAPPPTITTVSPTPGAGYSFTLGSGGVSVPVSFSATSLYGNVSAISATLNGNPVVLTQSGVGTSLVATGSASLSISTPGSYNLVFNASNEYGQAAPVTVPFSVTGLAPLPTVAIQSPAIGAVFTRTEGDPATQVNFTFSGATTYGSISSVAVTIDGAPVASTVNGIGTAAISGTGSVSYSAGGSHTLTVVVTSEGGTASASTTFTVQQNAAQICRDLTWLPPISLNKTIQGGSVMPIKFTLTCQGKFVRDTSVVIVIYEIFADSSISTPTIYPYGTGSPNPPDYAITGKQYHLNFDTAKGTHQYRIEVYSSASGSLQFIDSKDLFTKGKSSGGSGHDGDDDDDGEDDDDHGDHD